MPGGANIQGLGGEATIQCPPISICRPSRAVGSSWFGSPGTLEGTGLQITEGILEGETDTSL